MKSSLMSSGVAGLLAVFGAAFSLVGSQVGAYAVGPPTYVLIDAGAFGGEPTIASDSNGVLYDTTPSGGTRLYRSYDSGDTWAQVTTADPKSGDDCVTTDQSNAVYECNLAGTNTLPLQADVWKSLNQGGTWTKGANQVSGNGNTCGGSCDAFGVDRQWTTAWIPPGGTTANAHVVLMYHDFYGPSQIWVNVSTDGGATFAASKPVLLNPAATPGSVLGSGLGNLFSECNTVPSGIYTVKTGPHAGRIYVSWIAADAAQNTSGCNVSMAQSFHDLWVAWSDDVGNTWTTQQAFDGMVGHDASTPFATFTQDDKGNPYIAFADNLNANPATCSAESTTGGSALQNDTTCESNMYVVWSSDGGSTWDGGGGLVPGSAATPYQVNTATETGTHWFPTIAVGDPGHVDVGYLRTPTIQPTDSTGKADPGACAGPSTATPNYPPACAWNLFAGQSQNLTLPPGTATWTSSQLTAVPMHIGDICNLGIACVSSLGSNRSLLDFNSETVDPRGCAHIAYADNNNGSKTPPASPHNAHLVVATQVSGPSAFVNAPNCVALPVATPEVPWPGLLVPAAAAVAFIGWRSRRRFRTAAAS